MLYLPSELHDWYLRQRLDQGLSMYDIFKKILYEHANKEGFIHDHRFKPKWLTNDRGHKQEYIICIVCGEYQE